jgi:nitrogen fixation/metabolism regulation signal transduction histidine kinase
VDALLDRLGRTADLHVGLAAPDAANDVAVARCALRDDAGQELAVHAWTSRAGLAEDLGNIDRAIVVASTAALGLALLFAVLLARGLTRPLSELAAEARRVGTGEARPVRPRGAREVRDLALAFARMLDDLEATRQRLAAAVRIAAWQKAARRVAHEIKNPLAPIRAAIETLRRLRARNDPEFDAYFDEASRTVLAEVHRLADIVGEFTRFARLPRARPEDVDATEIAEHVVRLHAASGPAEIALAAPGPVALRADRDQVVQALTNLVQNAIDATRDVERACVTVSVAPAGANVHVVVADNGPGLAPTMTERLFEPYATTKASGTGLGLAISQRIAVEHGGELVYTGRGPVGGAAFRLVLPVAGPPPQSATDPSP